MEKYLKRIADSLERAFPLKPDTSFFERFGRGIWGFSVENQLILGLCEGDFIFRNSF